MDVNRKQIDTIESGYLSIKDFPDLLLRLSKIGDEHDIDVLYRDSRQDLLSLPLPAPVLEKMLTQQQLSQARGIAQVFPDAQTWVGEYKSRIVARLIFERGENTLRLIDIIISPIYQRRGLARRLITCLQKVASHFMIPLTLRVMKDNHAARELYLGCAFEIDAEDELSEQMSWRPKDSEPC